MRQEFVIWGNWNRECMWYQRQVKFSHNLTGTHHNQDSEHARHFRKSPHNPLVILPSSPVLIAVYDFYLNGIIHYNWLNDMSISWFLESMLKIYVYVFIPGTCEHYHIVFAGTIDLWILKWDYPRLSGRALNLLQIGMETVLTSHYCDFQIHL